MLRTDDGYTEAGIEPKPGKKNKLITLEIFILMQRPWACWFSSIWFWRLPNRYSGYLSGDMIVVGSKSRGFLEMVLGQIPLNHDL
jgi:hypothetical protein